MIVSHEHRFIFLKTRKTAGTSVEIALSKVCGPDDIITPISEEDEALRREVGGRSPQNFDSPPQPRKAYNHMRAPMVRRIVGQEIWDTYYKFTIERNPWDTVVSLYYWRFRSETPPPFAEFVQLPLIEKLARNTDIYRIAGVLAVDKVCRYESLGDELVGLWSNLKLPGSPDLPHSKGYARPARADYRDLFDDVSAERVRSLFADAITDFGYEF